jgi:hypothetical protein
MCEHVLPGDLSLTTIFVYCIQPDSISHLHCQLETFEKYCLLLKKKNSRIDR